MSRRFPGIRWVDLLVAVLTVPTISSARPLEPVGTGRWFEGVACRHDSTQTYTLYLPTSYRSDRRAPALLVFDPRGRSVAAAERFRPACERFGWIILSSNDTRSDGPWQPNARALAALWPEVHERFATDPRRIYAAGFSGGAIVAWYLAQFAKPPSIAGILASGGRPAVEIPVDTIRFAHFGTAGTLDFNYAPMKTLDALVAARGAPHQLRIFEGRHQWMPQEIATEGVEWMEVLAMRDELRDRDTKLVESIFLQQLRSAQSLESSGRALEALRRYRVIESSWDGLLSLDDVRTAIAALDTSRMVAQQRDDEQRADALEEERVRHLEPLLDELARGNHHESSAEWIGELGIRNLQHRAADESTTGVAAQRVLEWMFTRTSFYMSRDFFAAQRYGRARVALEVAVAIRPDSPRVWYDLACAAARSGDAAAAVDALGQAIDHGYRNLDHLTADPDLESIRGEPGYVRCVERLHASPEH